MALTENVAQPLIEAKNVSLEIRTVRAAMRGGRNSILSILKQSITSSGSSQKRRILRNLDFTISPGDRIGLIGPNGAGKTTLLLMLNGALRNTSGVLKINGATHALMNIRLGMKLRATGIENIYLNGFRLGFRSREIGELVDDVAAFCELGERIHEPVSAYSAGMQLRLAFGIATAITPDILLMDEWIGAGDQKFRQKAAERLKSVLEKSRGLVIASHNENLIRSLCNKVIYLENGEIRFIGDLDQGFSMFNESEQAG